MIDYGIFPPEFNFRARSIPGVCRSVSSAQVGAEGSDSLSDGPPDKYQTTGRIDSTDWRTGQPRTIINVILYTHIQVVYSGVNTTSPSTCGQANFA